MTIFIHVNFPLFHVQLDTLKLWPHVFLTAKWWSDQEICSGTVKSGTTTYVFSISELFTNGVKLAGDWLSFTCSFSGLTKPIAPRPWKLSLSYSPPCSWICLLELWDRSELVFYLIVIFPWHFPNPSPKSHSQLSNLIDPRSSNSQTRPHAHTLKTGRVGCEGCHPWEPGNSRKFRDLPGWSCRPPGRQNNLSKTTSALCQGPLPAPGQTFQGASQPSLAPPEHT